MFESYFRKKLPGLCHAPANIGKEMMIRIVCTLVLRVVERQHAGYGSLSRAQYPTIEQPAKYFCCRGGKNEQKTG